MTISVISIGATIEHQYIDNTFIDVATQLSEYDYCLVDPQSIRILVSDQSIQTINSVFAKFRKSIFEYMTNGGRLICILRPLLDEGRITNYDWLVDMHDQNKRAIIQTLFCRECEVTKFAKDWQHYLEYSKIKYLSSLSYCFPRMEVLAYADSNRVVAARISVGDGYLLFIPPIHDQDHKLLFIRTLRKAMQKPTDLDSNIAPSWLQQYELRKESEYASEVENLSERIKDLILEREIIKQRMLNLSHLNGLLWGSGIDVLENAVQRAFQILGFDAKPQDSVDLVLSCNIGQAYVEIHGTKNMVRVRKVEQLSRYILNNFAKSGEKVKGILVGNAFRIEDIHARPPLQEQFSLEIQEFAKSNGIAILATVTLYKLVDQILMGELNSEEIRSLIFNTNGIMETDF